MCICMYSPQCYPSTLNSLGGPGSGGAPKPKRQRPRKLIRNDEGVFVDTTVTEQRRRDEQRAEEAEKRNEILSCLTSPSGMLSKSTFLRIYMFLQKGPFAL